MVYVPATHTLIGICQCLQEGSWVNEEPYEVQGVNIGNSTILSEAPRKGRHNRAQQVLLNLLKVLSSWTVLVDIYTI